MNNLQAQLMGLWEAAVQDDPKRPSCIVRDGLFEFTVRGNRDRWVEFCTLNGIPADHEEEVLVEDGVESLKCTWVSWGDRIFDADGLIAERLPNYEVRLPQLQMARMVQRAFEMKVPAVIEAGTGVGKSFAYAAVAMATGKKVVISTSNKALQMQLYKKDIPFLQSIFPGKRVAVAQGKSNYACRLKVEGPGAKRPAPGLAQWYEETETGNVEEIDFAVDWKSLSDITVDDDCTGKACPFFFDCFYYRAKDERKNADVIITNHALLALNQLYPGAGILPSCDVLVVDEAHKLPDFVRNALGVEFRLESVGKVLDVAEAYVEGPEALEGARSLLLSLERDVRSWLNDVRNPKSGKLDPQVGLNDKVFDKALKLSELMLDVANEVWNEDELPSEADDRKRAKRADRIRKMADRVATLGAKPEALVRWVDTAEPLTVNALPADVSAFIGRMAGVITEVTGTEPVPDHTRCARCRRELTADRVAILEGRPYGPECIKHVDPLGDAEVVNLADWLGFPRDKDPEEDTTTFDGQSVVFCSATLATPTLSSFMRECGIPNALQMVAASPFDYERNAVFYLPGAGFPAPDAPNWKDSIVEEIRTMVEASDGGAFLLFTSFAAMNYAVQALRPRWKNRTVLVQGELPKLEIAKRFAADGSAILFATKSFFEGVSIDGSALRLVLIDKMPFAAPSPLSTAIEAAALDKARAAGLRGVQLERFPFNEVRVPAMLVDLKQGVGRLIRTQTDRGVFGILDSRIRSSQYGRSMVIPSLPPAPIVSSLDSVADFLRSERPEKVAEPVVVNQLSEGAMNRVRQAWGSMQ